MTDMAFMVKDGFRLYYEDTGGAGPTLLFLHGAGGNHLSWWQQVPVFAEEYRCITVDQRGFGQSPDVSGGPGPGALGSDALALLDYLGIEQAAVVAQSMGGWAAVGAGVHAPRRFWAIVLANTVGNLSNPDIAPLPADFRDRLGRLTTEVERYAAARIPTMFLTSDEDGLIWPELSHKVHEHIPGSRFERVAAAGHSTYFERPDVFNREVGAFLKEHRP